MFTTKIPYSIPQLRGTVFAMPKGFLSRQCTFSPGFARFASVPTWNTLFTKEPEQNSSNASRVKDVLTRTCTGFESPNHCEGTGKTNLNEIQKAFLRLKDVAESSGVDIPSVLHCHNIEELNQPSGSILTALLWLETPIQGSDLTAIRTFFVFAESQYNATSNEGLKKILKSILDTIHPDFEKAFKHEKDIWNDMPLLQQILLHETRGFAAPVQNCKDLVDSIKKIYMLNCLSCSPASYWLYCALDMLSNSHKNAEVQNYAKAAIKEINESSFIPIQT